jgi:hypothetical protein
MRRDSCSRGVHLVAWAFLGAVLFTACGPQEQLAQQSANAVVSTRPVQTPFVAWNSTFTPQYGVHAQHAAAAPACTVCHLKGGIVQFDPRGAAVIPGTVSVNAQGVVTVLVPSQVPTYNPTNGTCSNIACHYVKPFVYTPPDGLGVFGDPYSYNCGSGPTTTTPDWYNDPTTFSDCAACHGYAPYSDGGVWHSGWHGGVNVNSATNPDGWWLNACSTCHSDVTTTLSGTLGTAGARWITTFKDPTKHANGVVDVDYTATAEWPCTNCHGG